MASQTHALETAKNGAIEAEHVNQLDLKEQDVENPQVDKFGSVTKRDPRETALVRKLDLFMMVCRGFDTMCSLYLTHYSPPSG